MNRILAIILIFLLLLATINTFTGCVSKSKFNDLEERLQALIQEKAGLETSLFSTKTELESVKSNFNEKVSELNGIQSQLKSTAEELDITKGDLVKSANALQTAEGSAHYAQQQLDEANKKLTFYDGIYNFKLQFNVQPNYDKPVWLDNGDVKIDKINLVENASATDPTYAQLKDFLIRDSVNQAAYWEGKLECTYFAEAVHNNAEKAGLKCAFVAVFFEDEVVGHALNSFVTSDKGLVFVDCTGGSNYLLSVIDRKEFDSIAYVVVGKEYRSLSIQAADSPIYSFIEKYSLTHPYFDQLFSGFLGPTAAYNESVRQYNKDVAEFNKQYEATPKPLTNATWLYFSTWYNRLMATSKSLNEQWVNVARQRIAVLEYIDKNGLLFYEPNKNIVKTIELYW